MQTSILQHLRAFTLFLLAALGIGIVALFLFNSKAPAEAEKKPVTQNNDLYTISETVGTKDFPPNTDVKFVFDRLNGKILYGKGWGGNYVSDSEGTGGTELWMADEKQSFDTLLVAGYDVIGAFFAPDDSIFYGLTDQDLYRLRPGSTAPEKILTKVSQPSISPDGTTLVYQKLNQDHPAGPYFDDALGLHTYNLITRAETKVSDKWEDFGPVWSPSGQKIFFFSAGPTGDMGLFSVNPDGSKRTQLTNLQPNNSAAVIPIASERPIWSSDGKFFVYESDRKIWVLEINKTHDRVVTARDIGLGIAPEWVLDGKTLRILPPTGDSHSLPTKGTPKIIDLFGKTLQ